MFQATNDGQCLPNFNNSFDGLPLISPKVEQQNEFYNFPNQPNYPCNYNNFEHMDNKVPTDYSSLNHIYNSSLFQSYSPNSQNNGPFSNHQSSLPYSSSCIYSPNNPYSMPNLSSDNTNNFLTQSRSLSFEQITSQNNNDNKMKSNNSSTVNSNENGNNNSNNFQNNSIYQTNDNNCNISDNNNNPSYQTPKLSIPSLKCDTFIQFPYPTSNSNGTTNSTNFPATIKSSLSSEGIYNPQTTNHIIDIPQIPQTYYGECVNCGSTLESLCCKDTRGQYLCQMCYQNNPNVEINTVSKRSNHLTKNISRKQQTAKRNGQLCSNCKTDHTTLWRRNTEGQQVCNACGLYYKLHKTPRPPSMKKETLQTRKRKAKKRKYTDSDFMKSDSTLYPHAIAAVAAAAHFNPLTASSNHITSSGSQYSHHTGPSSYYPPSLLHNNTPSTPPTQYPTTHFPTHNLQTQHYSPIDHNNTNNNNNNNNSNNNRFDYLMNTQSQIHHLLN